MALCRRDLKPATWCEFEAIGRKANTVRAGPRMTALWLITVTTRPWTTALQDDDPLGGPQDDGALVNNDNGEILDYNTPG